MRPAGLENAMSSYRDYYKWVRMMLIISVLYILAELAFNASLLNVSSGLVLDPEELDRVETFGRLLASLGCSLFVFGFIQPSKCYMLSGNDPYYFFSPRKAMQRLLVTIAIVGPVFYGAMEVAIDEWVVKPSTGEARWTAYMGDLVKRSEAAGLRPGIGMKALEGVETDPANPEAMTYYALSTAVMLNVPDWVKHYHSKGEMQDLLDRYISLRIRHEQADLYAAYRDYEPTLERAWVNYRKAAREFNTRFGGISNQKFNEVWGELRSELRRNWPRADKSISAARKKEVDMTRFLAETWYEQYVSYRKGRRGRHISRLETEGLPGVQRYMRKDLQHINYFAKVCGGRGKIGRTCFPSENDFFNYFWNLFPKSDNIDKRSGYPITVRTYSDFLNHEKTGREVRLKLEKELRIDLPSSFDKAFRGSPQVTRRYINEAVKEESLVAWRKAVARQLGVSAHQIRRLGPQHTTFASFIIHVDIANLIRQETGGFYSNRLALNMTEAEFRAKVIPDIYRRKKREMGEKFQRTHFSMMGTQRDSIEGMSYYRAAVIPPIALGLSLFFSLVAIFKLPLMVSELIYAKSEGERDYQRRARGILIGGILAILLIPFLVSEDSLDKGMNSSLYILESRDRGLLAKAAHWVYVTEPVFYRVGQTIISMLWLDNREVVNVHMNANR